MTKPRSIRIQFYVLVPLIFAGFTALAAQLTYHLMRSGAVAADRTWPLLATAGLLVATAFLCGLFILQEILSRAKFRDLSKARDRWASVLESAPRAAPPPRPRRVILPSHRSGGSGGW